MRKTTMIVAAAVVLLAALVAGQLFMTRDASDAGRGSSSADPSGSARLRQSDVATIPPLPSIQRGLAPITPHGPLKAGDPLPPMAASPGGLVSAFSDAAAPAGTTFVIIFRPWGMGPVSPSGRTVVASIYSAQKDGEPSSLLTKRTVLLVMDSRNGGTVIQGGTYRGVITFAAAREGSIPLLSKVEPTSP